ncbi:MAG TPA: hypothetical protein VMW48_08385 [Vicinamibacterales bacterium]|nr:hypothetical protein [Vicinamibacterales bacterium]
MSTYPLRCTEHTRVAGWMSALVATATFSYLHEAYDRIPLLVPIQFEDGSPIQFAFKSPELVYLPFGLQLALGVIFAAVVALIIHRSVKPVTGSETRGALAAQHTAEGVALLALVWIAFQAVNAWRLATLWRRTFDGNIELYVLALITALTATIIVGARVVMKVQETGAGMNELHAPVVERRRPLASAGLAALLAMGIAAPLYLLATVFGALKPI